MSIYLSILPCCLFSSQRNSSLQAWLQTSIAWEELKNNFNFNFFFYYSSCSSSTPCLQLPLTRARANPTHNWTARPKGQEGQSQASWVFPYLDLRPSSLGSFTCPCCCSSFLYLVSVDVSKLTGCCPRLDWGCQQGIGLTNKPEDWDTCWQDETQTKLFFFNYTLSHSSS